MFWSEDNRNRLRIHSRWQLEVLLGAAGSGTIPTACAGRTHRAASAVGSWRCRGSSTSVHRPSAHLLVQPLWHDQQARALTPPVYVVSQAHQSEVRDSVLSIPAEMLPKPFCAQTNCLFKEGCNATTKVCVQLPKQAKSRPDLGLRSEDSRGAMWCRLPLVTRTVKCVYKWREQRRLRRNR